jgi:hypothetical protein
VLFAWETMEKLTMVVVAVQGAPASLTLVVTHTLLEMASFLHRFTTSASLAKTSL